MVITRVLHWQENLKITWNWNLPRPQGYMVFWGFGSYPWLVDDQGVVPGGPLFFGTLYRATWCTRGPPPPLGWWAHLLVFNFTWCWLIRLMSTQKLNIWFFGRKFQDVIGTIVLGRVVLNLLKFVPILSLIVANALPSWRRWRGCKKIRMEIFYSSLMDLLRLLLYTCMN